MKQTDKQTNISLDWEICQYVLYKEYFVKGGGGFELIRKKTVYSSLMIQGFINYITNILNHKTVFPIWNIYITIFLNKLCQPVTAPYSAYSSYSSTITVLHLGRAIARFAHIICRSHILMKSMRAKSRIWWSFLSSLYLDRAGWTLQPCLFSLVVKTKIRTKSCAAADLVISRVYCSIRQYFIFLLP
jgi:hypothetical protein